MSTPHGSTSRAPRYRPVSGWQFIDQWVPGTVCPKCQTTDDTVEVDGYSRVHHCLAWSDPGSSGQCSDGHINWLTNSTSICHPTPHRSATAKIIYQAGFNQL